MDRSYGFHPPGHPHPDTGYIPPLGILREPTLTNPDFDSCSTTSNTHINKYTDSSHCDHNPPADLIFGGGSILFKWGNDKFLAPMVG